MRVDRLLVPPPPERGGIVDVPPVGATSLGLLFPVRTPVDVVVEVPHPPRPALARRSLVGGAYPQEVIRHVLRQAGFPLVDRDCGGRVTGYHVHDAVTHAARGEEGSQYRGQVLDAHILAGYSALAHPRGRYRDRMVRAYRLPEEEGWSRGGRGRVFSRRLLGHVRRRF